MANLDPVAAVFTIVHIANATARAGSAAASS
jgi:hypothetical protein